MDILVNNAGHANLSGGVLLEALPGVVDRVAGRVPVLVDGGARRGTDLVIALAMGAVAVQLRPDGRSDHGCLAHLSTRQFVMVESRSPRQTMYPDSLTKH